jgi:putative hemolysin
LAQRSVLSELLPRTPAPSSDLGWSGAPDLDLKSGPYRLRFARSEADLQDAFRLRFQVFNLELGEGLDQSFPSGLDRDRYDAQCHHLVVEHGAEIIGTYRLQTIDSARAGQGFYSATEFDLQGFPDGFLNQAVELGRACIAKSHRNRRVLLLLWTGLAAYREHFHKRYFFGCNSLTSQDPELGWRTYQHLREKQLLVPEYQLQTRPGWHCPSPIKDDGAATGRKLFAARPKIPPLFAAYLRYGARVCSVPALDQEFGTIDFLTMLDLDQMDPSTYQRFRS